MGLVNEGTIDANQSSALSIRTSNGTTNTGLLEATTGANLILHGDTYTNTGGTILASGTGSIVTLEGPTINGGRPQHHRRRTDSGGRQSGFEWRREPGHLPIPNSNNTTLMGTIANTGTIQLNSSGTQTDLVHGRCAVTLTGGGTVTLSNSDNNGIYGAVATDVLTNVNNTIQGSGFIGNAQMGLVNQGTIDANQSTPLYIHTSNGTTNTGTLEATAGANLILVTDTFTNAAGAQSWPPEPAPW